MKRPDHLVLGAGGTLGVAWLRGLLAGLERATGWDAREAESFVGTSAGSIVAARLASGWRPETAATPEGRAWAQAAPEAEMERDGGRGWLAWVGSAVRPLAPYAIAATASGGAAVRAAALAAMPEGRPGLKAAFPAMGRIEARFDGRLRVTAVDRSSGRRVVFGAPEAPEAPVGDAVLASCSIPWVFAPVEIGGRSYVDGGVWSPTNLDATPAERGQTVLCLVPTGAAAAAPSPLALLRMATHASLLAETTTLRARGVRVRVVTPDRTCARAMGTNLMDASRVDAVARAAAQQGETLAERAVA